MAFRPFLDVCFENCSTIKFVDTTNIYSSANTVGWNSPNITSAVVTAATILVTDSDGDTLFTYDVLDQLPATVTGDIVYESYEYAVPDGEFTVTYTLTTASATYTYTTTLINSCNFECCINHLIATVPAKICANRCDTDYIDEVLTIEGLYYGYLCAAMCEKTSIQAEIEKRLERFCDFQCNCS